MAGIIKGSLFSVSKEDADAMRKVAKDLKTQEAAETVDIQCEIRARSALAWLIYDGAKTVWVPISEIVASATDSSMGNPKTTITIPAWLAAEKQLSAGKVDNDTADLFGGEE